MISMIKGKIKIINNSQIFRQPDLMASFESEIELHNSHIYDINLEKNHIVFHLLSSKFKMVNTQISKIDCGLTKDESIFQVRLESTFTTATSEVYNTTCQVAFLLYSTAQMDTLKIRDSSTAVTILEAVESVVKMNNSEFNDVSTLKPHIIRIENSQDLLIENTKFIKANKDYFFVTGSKGTIQ